LAGMEQSNQDLDQGIAVREERDAGLANDWVQHFPWRPEVDPNRRQTVQ
jgi:hypothetical protein